MTARITPWVVLILVLMAAVSGVMLVQGQTPANEHTAPDGPSIVAYTPIYDEPVPVTQDAVRFDGLTITDTGEGAIERPNNTYIDVNRLDGQLTIQDRIGEIPTTTIQSDAGGVVVGVELYDYGYDNGQADIAITNSDINVSMTFRGLPANETIVLASSEGGADTFETDAGGTGTATVGQVGTYELLPEAMIDLDVRSPIEANETVGYTVTYMDNGQSEDVTDSATVTSSNTSVLTVDSTNNTVTAVGERGSNATLTATYDSPDYGTLTDSQDVTIVEYSLAFLHTLSGWTAFAVLMSNWGLLLLLISSALATVGARVGGPLLGLAVGLMCVVLLWVMGHVETGVVLITLFATLFIGLNIAANIRYAPR